MFSVNILACFFFFGLFWPKTKIVTTYPNESFGSVSGFQWMCTSNSVIWQTFKMNLISVCDDTVSSYRGKRESKRKNVQLCQQQVDSSKPHRVFYLCRQELHWTVALFPRRPQSETCTRCRHENRESTGNTLSSILTSMTTYRYRVYVSCRPVYSK